ncbi:MAG TPA: glutamine amidotransferase [Nocardioidaceae bacterium]|nr:glutamine amidotransferase [Nocardioidaceae bacterium]
MKPFLLLSSRAEDIAADDEYAAFLRDTGLPPRRLVRVRMEQGPLPRIELDDYAGIFLGGGPFNSSDPVAIKSSVQLRVEREVSALLDEVVARDFPFMGACYGVGTLGVHQGGVVDRRYPEPIGATAIALTEEGKTDPVLAGMPPVFVAYVGHKEACSVLPPTATLLAASPLCPVQMFRVKQNLYATQFHPELDRAGIITRVRVYQHYGYFPPEEMEPLIARLNGTKVTHPPRVLANFAALYG